MSNPVKIELRLSDIAPPTAEPRRTSYMDIVNMPDPVVFGLTCKWYNQDNVTLYFKLSGEATGWTFTEQTLGALAAGGNSQGWFDNFFQHAKPSAGDLPGGLKSELIALKLKAYTDAGYTNLKWTYTKNVTVVWINSADAAWTTDFSDNFDDGTVMGWAAANETGFTSVSAAAASDYRLSVPYSLRMTCYTTTVRYNDYQCRARMYKSFNTPDKNYVFAILDLRISRNLYGGGTLINRTKYVKTQNGDTVLIFTGKPQDTVDADYVPINKWVRQVIPLPKNTSVEVRVVGHEFMHNYWTTVGENMYMWIWLDDFKIVSKD